MPNNDDDLLQTSEYDVRRASSEALEVLRARLRQPRNMSFDQLGRLTFTPSEPAVQEENYSMPGQFTYSFERDFSTRTFDEPIERVDLGSNSCTCPDCSNDLMIGTQAEISGASALAEAANLLSTSYNPARSTELRWIHNGIYRVQHDGSAFEIRLHTVLNGRLRGFRILQLRTSGRWEGFATLNVEGTVWVWRSHEEWRGNQMHILLNSLFNQLFSNSGVRMMAGDSISTRISAISSSMTLTLITCNACNSAHEYRCSMCSPACLQAYGTISRIRDDEYLLLPGNVRRAAARPARTNTPRTATQPPRATRELLMSTVLPDEVR